MWVRGEIADEKKYAREKLSEMSAPETITNSKQLGCVGVLVACYVRAPILIFPVLTMNDFS